MSTNDNEIVNRISKWKISKQWSCHCISISFCRDIMVQEETLYINNKRNLNGYKTIE